MAIASDNSEIRRLVMTRWYSSVWTNLVGRCQCYTSTEAAPRPALVRAALRCDLLNGKSHARGRVRHPSGRAAATALSSDREGGSTRGRENLACQLANRFLYLGSFFY